MDRFSNPNMLLAFVTVAREGSVSRAAEILNLTQPAVSHQLRRLGEELGVQLFQRLPNGMEITDDGAALVPKAEQVLTAMGELRRAANQRASQISGSLKIGTIVDPEFIRLGRVLHQLQRDYPGIQTEIAHGVSGQVLQRLLRRQIDVGYYLCGPDDLESMYAAHNPPLHILKLTDFQYRVIAPAGWQQRVEDADWPALAGLPWIGTPDVSVHNRLLSKIFDQHDCQPNIVALVDQEASMLEMVRSGVGLSLSRDSIALHHRQTFGLAVGNKVSVPACLCFVALEERMDNPLIQAIFTLLDRYW